MLPREADSIYGGGLAGGIFRDMYAAEIASEIARAGGIGVADRLAVHYGREGDGRALADPDASHAGRVG
jgi:Rod binding domain-containing protein